MKGDKAMENKKLQKVEGHDLVWTDGEKLYGRRFPEEESSNTTDTTNQNTDAKLRKVEGHDLVWTDGKKLYGRRFPDEENSGTTAEGERLIREAKKNYQEQTKRNDDNMINGDDGTKLSQKKQASSEYVPEEVIITRQHPKKEEKPTSEQIEADKDAIEIKRRNIEEVKKVTNEATTGENIDNSAESGVNKKTPINDLKPEDIKKWVAKITAGNNESRAYLQKNLERQ